MTSFRTAPAVFCGVGSEPDPRGASDVQLVAIASIQTSGTQSRKQLEPKTVADIREEISWLDKINPIVLFFDGDRHWIGDGYHRLEAHIKEKKDFIRAYVRRGSKDDALRFNIESNASADKTRWTNADKRNAVTMLLKIYGYAEGEVSRKKAEEIMTLAKCSRDHVYEVAKELRATGRRTTSDPVPTQPAVSQAVSNESVPEDGTEDREQAPSTKRKKSPTTGRRQMEMAERDEKIAALVEEGCIAAEIARRLGVAESTVGESLRRQKLTPATANPLVDVLKRAQLAASEWESIVSLLLSGSGAAASWPTATDQQKQEVTDYVRVSIRYQTEFIKRLNKEAKR